MNLKHLTDPVLLSRLEALVSQERGGIADIVEHLAEVDRREIVVDAGYPTLFDYCVKTLRYSEAAAFLRIRAARAATEFPRVLDGLRSGALHLDAVMRLSPHLTATNSDRLLDQASGATKRDVLAMVAALGGAQAATERDVVRRLPPKRAEPPEQPERPERPDAAAQLMGADLPSLFEPQTARSGASVVIIPPASRVRLAFTVDDDFLLMVDRLRRLRRHKFPEGRLEDLLRESVAALLDKIDPDRRKGCGAERKTKAGLETKSSLKTKSGAMSGSARRVSNAVKRAVWKRDEGRCAYRSPDGRRCEARDFLEYDHILPWSLGGASSQENIRLLCRPHNQRLARKRFGPRRRAPAAPGRRVLTASGRSECAPAGLMSAAEGPGGSDKLVGTPTNLYFRRSAA